MSGLFQRIMNLVSRGTIKKSDDSKDAQLVQVALLDDETRDQVERFQNYGFTSHAPVGAETLVIFPGGDRSQGVAIAVEDRRYRLISLTSGEVAVYDKTGSKIVLKSNGDIEIVPSSGNVNVTGTLTASVDVVGGGKSLKNHKHTIAASCAAAPGPVLFLPTDGTTGAPS